MQSVVHARLAGLEWIGDAADAMRAQQLSHTGSSPLQETRSVDSELYTLQNTLRKHVDALAVQIGPRTPSNPKSLVRAANYIHSALKRAGLSVSEQSYHYFDEQVTNVFATIPSTAGTSAYYVVGAHYDTVPDSPGADDNASGVAVMLELAGRFRQKNLKVPVVFAAFTLEEPPAFSTGHQGSRVFVRACQINGDRVIGAIVLEMVGYTAPSQRYPFISRWPGYPAEGNFIGIIGNWRSRKFGRTVVKAFRQNRDLNIASLFLPFDGRILPETRLSDHASFWDAGLPALMVTDTAFFRNPNYHLASDTIETLDFVFMAQLVKSLEIALLGLPSSAQWI
jgi:hypothetical protein